MRGAGSVLVFGFHGPSGAAARATAIVGSLLAPGFLAGLLDGHLQGQGVLVAGQRQHRLFQLGIDPQHQRAQDRFVQVEVALEVDQVVALGAEVGQVKQALLVADPAALMG